MIIRFDMKEVPRTDVWEVPEGKSWQFTPEAA
jgi:hypothetical protein